MCQSPITIKDSNGIRHVPCGTCRECLQKRKTDWTIRTMFEWEDTVINHGFKPYFICLTYDDTRIPICEKNGNFYGVLQYSDWHDCLHYLLDTKCIKAAGYDSNGVWNEGDYRFLMCGEYGALRSRPHYHILLFAKSEEVPIAIRDYWYKRHCPEALELVESGRYKLGEVGVHITNVRSDGESAAKVSRYISKYVSKGSFDFSKQPELREYYKDFPSRLYCSRGYGMQRLESYKQLLSQFKFPKFTILWHKCYRSFGTNLDVQRVAVPYRRYTEKYLHFVSDTLRVNLGSNLKTGNGDYYAPLPQCYIDKLFPKHVHYECFKEFLCGDEEVHLTKKERVNHEVSSLYGDSYLPRALAYLREKDRTYRDVSNMRARSGNSQLTEQDPQFGSYLIQEFRSTRFRNARSDADFVNSTESWLLSQIDYQ